jgi:hypothetical protein
VRDRGDGIWRSSFSSPGRHPEHKTWHAVVEIFDALATDREGDVVDEFACEVCKASGSPDHETLRRASRDLRTNPAEALRKLCADPLPENYSAAHGTHAMWELARRAHVRITAAIRSDIPARLRDELNRPTVAP